MQITIELEQQYFEVLQQQAKILKKSISEVLL